MTDREHDNPDPPPDRPEPSECCGSGCSPCIFDMYEDKLARWRERQPRRRDDTPETDPGREP